MVEAVYVFKVKNYNYTMSNGQGDGSTKTYMFQPANTSNVVGKKKNNEVIIRGIPCITS